MAVEVDRSLIPGGRPGLKSVSGRPTVTGWRWGAIRSRILLG